MDGRSCSGIFSKFSGSDGAIFIIGSNKGRGGGNSLLITTPPNSSNAGCATPAIVACVKSIPEAKLPATFLPTVKAPLPNLLKIPSSCSCACSICCPCAWAIAS